MLLMRVLCRRCHTDQVMKSDKTTQDHSATLQHDHTFYGFFTVSGAHPLLL